jgi:N-glycosylase/DNA lyase
MHDLIKAIEELKKNEVRDLVNTRMSEFSMIREASQEQIFSELCFCIMTANCGAEKCIEIHEHIGDEFIDLSQGALARKFKELGYRFPNVRSGYISEAQEYIQQLKDILNSNTQENELREWIVKNIKGLGYKEGSHFLRNIGFTNYAIIDFHIIDLLVKYNLIEKPKTLTKRKYLEIEELLMQIANKLDLNLAELDLYLWYLETGKVLK